MEPASSNTVKARSRDEKAKFTAELKMIGGKRKREPNDSDDENNSPSKGTEQAKPKKKKGRGPREPNPLSVKKRKATGITKTGGTPSKPSQMAETEEVKADNESILAKTGEASSRKRQRKRKTKATTALSNENPAQTESPAAKA